MIKRAFIFFLLLISLFLSACSSVPEKEQSISPSQEEEILIPSPVKREPSGYSEVKIYFDGLLSDRGFYENQTLFMAPEAICRYFELECETKISEDGFMISFPGLSLCGKPEQEYVIANDRYLYTPYFYIEHEGRIYLSQDIIERVFGVKLNFSPEEMKAEMDYAVLHLIKGGENYYIANYPNEELYWLSRVIYAEAKDQPMAGLIGVGNVVYNRVESDDFPHTVFDVIFDNKNAVQFDPTATGGILGEPDRRSEIAACLCMEGYNTVGDCMFFVNPDRGDSTWFDKELEFVVSLGDHDFYR